MYALGTILSPLLPVFYKLRNHGVVDAAKAFIFQGSCRAGAGVVHHNLPRGKTVDDVAESLPSSCREEHEERSSHLTANDLIATVDVADVQCCAGSEVSLYAVKERAAATAWANIRPALLKAVVEGSAMSPDQRCTMCPAAASYHCIQCAPWAFYCHNCFGLAHSRVHLFHIGEVWEVCKIDE